MQEIIAPARAIEGIIALPGDKSISHRYAMLAAIAQGETTIANYSTGADCQSTLACMEALGAKVERRKVADDGGDDDGQIIIAIQGGALREPAAELDAGNSGSTIRMLSGILAAQPFTSRIGGDESLSRRPMQRIMTPLAQMGAQIEARDGKFPPLVIHGRGRGHGRPLHAIDYTLPVPSAQVKSCVLLAGLFAEGDTIVREPVRTRDHTEIALRAFGAEIETERRVITLRSGATLAGLELGVPGDLSSAAFFLVAALLMPEANLAIHSVGLNPTRSALLDFLVSMGASIKILDLRQVNGELIGDLRVRTSRTSGKMSGGVIEGAMTAALIDEIPALAVLGAASSGGLTVRDASELRVKETDRIAVLEENFRRMGVTMETTPDGFHVPGGQRFHAAELDSAGDHRIAMAFAVASLAADGPSIIQGAEAAGVSFPNFSLYYGRLAVNLMQNRPLDKDRAQDLRLPGLVHDLNNVFQTLVEAAELLPTDPETAFLSAAILRNVERGRNLTASIESAEGESAPFENILEGAISFVEDSLIARRGPKIRFTRSVERGIELRRNWAWERVLINLFSNAVLAMPEGGVIHVSAHRVPAPAPQGAAAIEIVVRDEGPGIAPEILAGIFKPHVSTRGSGLGLHIVETIVKRDGGEVRASNRAGGRGAEFTIIVPSHAGKRAEKAEPALTARA